MLNSMRQCLPKLVQSKTLYRIDSSSMVPTFCIRYPPGKRWPHKWEFVVYENDTLLLKTSYVSHFAVLLDICCHLRNPAWGSRVRRHFGRPLLPLADGIPVLTSDIAPSVLHNLTSYLWQILWWKRFANNFGIPLFSFTSELYYKEIALNFYSFQQNKILLM